MALLTRLQNAYKGLLNPKAQKYYNNWSIGNAFGGYGGLTYPNRDIQDNAYGYATAYMYIWYVRACVDLYAQMTEDIKSRIVYNKTPQLDNDEIVATSTDTRPTHIWYKTEYDHRTDFGQPLISAMVYQYMLYDMVFVEKMDNAFGYAGGVRVLNALGMHINRNDGDEYQTQPIQSYNYNWYGVNESFAPDEIAYTHGFNPYDDLLGSPIAQSVIDKINIDRNLDRFLRSFFINDARPSLVGSPDRDFVSLNGGLAGLTDEQIASLKKVLDDNHKGVNNFWRPLITNVPINWQPLDPPEIQSFVDMQQSIQRQVFGAFGVNPALVGLTENTNYKEGLEIRAQFIQDRLKPVLSRMEYLINDELLPYMTRGNENYRFEFDYSAYNLITEQDIQRNEIATNNYLSGLWTLNESREYVDSVPLDGGDTFSNGVTEDQLSQGVVLPQNTELVVGESVSDDKQPRLSVADISLKAVPEKYNHIDFKPNDAMVNEAKRGLEWRKKFNRGGTEVGVARARDIANRKNLSPDTVKRMHSYFSRHEVDKQGPGFNRGTDGYPSAGRIAWALWGGDAGQSWANRRVEQMETADNSDKSHICDDTCECDTCKHDHNAIPDDMSYEDYGKSLYQALPSQADMVKELQSWRKFVNNGTYIKRAFTPDKTRGDYADAIQELINNDASKAHIVDSIDSAIKDIESVRIDYELNVEDLIEQARNESITKRQFRTRMMANVRAYSISAYIEGLRRGGVIGQEPDENEQSEIERHVRKQRAYVNELSDVLYDGNGISDAEAANKPAMWWNKSISSMYQAGLASADKNGIYEWVIGPTEEHCKDCSQLNGQRHRMKTYYSRGILPQSDLLECGGFNCKCRLVRVNARARGRLPKL